MRYVVFILSLFLLLVSQVFGVDSATALPASPLARTAYQKFQEAVAKAQKTGLDARTAWQDQYKVELDRAMRSALSANNVEDAKWVKEELERIKSGPEMPGLRPKGVRTIGLLTRYSKLNEKLQDDNRRVMDALRRQYILDLEAAKKVATTQLSDLEEAERIVAEIARAKTLDLAIKPNGPDPNATPAEIKEQIVQALTKVSDALQLALEDASEHPEQYNDPDILNRARLGHQLNWGTPGEVARKFSKDLIVFKVEVATSNAPPDSERARRFYDDMDHDVYRVMDKARLRFTVREPREEWALHFEAIEHKIDVWQFQLNAAGLKDPRTKEEKEKARSLSQQDKDYYTATLKK